MADEFQYGKKSGRWLAGGLVSLVVIAVLMFMLRDTAVTTEEDLSDGLMIYCAAGIRKPVEELANRYSEEFGVPIRIDYGSSGELEGKLQLDRDNGKKRADLYIPADAFFSGRVAEKGLTKESLPLATFRLVLAKNTAATADLSSLDLLLESKVGYVLCDKNAGVGKKTAKTLGDRYAEIDAGKKATFPRVPEAANAIANSDGIVAGFIWDTTAKQFGLEIVEVPALKDAASTISANVVTTSERPAAALKFARYMSAPEHGGKIFGKHHFTHLPGDQWEESPTVTLYCGGVNRTAVAETIDLFQKREGVRVDTSYAGCGTLVATMKSIDAGQSAATYPDAFMTCDASYMPKVQENFAEASDVSSTEIVMLVRKGNPKNIKKVEDLAGSGAHIGTTDRTQSTLGDLSWQIFDQVGIKDKLEADRSVIVTTPTAHELIMQMTSHSKLDVALVYRANCNNVGENFELVAIDHPLATAIQNIAVAHGSKFPLLTGRLMQAIASSESRSRFEANGFEWKGQDGQ